MKTKILRISSAVFLCTSFFASAAQAETPSPIILSEIQIAGEKSNDEFVELYNAGTDSLDLFGFQLRRKTGGGTESSIKVFEKNSIIPAQGSFLWANSKGIFASPLADAETSSSALADNNSIALFTKSGADGVLIDSIAWGSGASFDPQTPPFSAPPKNKSLRRDIGTRLWSLADIPSPTNSRGVTYTAPLPIPPLPPAGHGRNIRINEIFPNPKAEGDAGEFIELYSFGTEPADISGWILRDATKTGKYIFPAGTLMAENAYLSVSDQSFRLSLNNTGETLSLFDASNMLVDSVHYEKTKDDVSLNYTAAGWRGGKPTPGAANILNNLPETREKVPRRGYKGVPVEFSAAGKDTDGDTLKYAWDFGDGHRSYKEKTSHTYEENGTYAVTLTVSDGNEDATETFTLKIQNFPHPEIRIIALSPNPEGRDSDHEWILLENREKKAVNLKGFGIATGWKNLVNHPIREDFIMEPKQPATLTRAFSLFTLPNQKGRIELRAPDGKVLQKIKYALEKSAAENTVYRKEKGSRWEWQAMKKEPEAVLRVPAAEVQTDTEAEAMPNIEERGEAVLGASVLGGASPARYERDRKWLTLLNFGTRVRLPERILFVPSGEKEPAVTAGAPEHYAMSFAKESLSLLNASLNGLLDNQEE